MDSRLNREAEFHNKTYESDSRDKLGKYYAIARKSRDYYENFLAQNCANKKVLEYGCGEGSYGYFLAKKGASVSGIDISDFAIKEANEIAKKENLKIDFKVMNAEALEYKDNTFDLICGTGILHHLDLDKALEEIARTLTNNGKAIFIEPLGHNLFINIFRKLTPNLRTEDEHPLKVDDINNFKNIFGNVDLYYFHLFSLAAVPFHKANFFKGLLSFLDSIDATLFKLFPILKKYAWMVVIVFSNPTE